MKTENAFRVQALSIIVAHPAILKAMLGERRGVVQDDLEEYRDTWEASVSDIPNYRTLSAQDKEVLDHVFTLDSETAVLYFETLPDAIWESSGARILRMLMRVRDWSNQRAALRKAGKAPRLDGSMRQRPIVDNPLPTPKQDMPRGELSRRDSLIYGDSLWLR